MKKILFIIVFGFTFYSTSAYNKIRTIHVYVALCDNINQGIVPVSSKLGNGQDPKNNLYWGAMYGVKSYFKRSKDWELVSKVNNKEEHILERLLFKHKTKNVFLLADAYDGKYIKQATVDFLEATAGNNSIALNYNQEELLFGGGADLTSYIGHDGLMEFSVEGDFHCSHTINKATIILACVSKEYFKPHIELTKANPLVWSTGLMSPEAYTLKAAIDGWVLKESNAQIRQRAAQAYHKYQKCGMRGARNLLVTGY